jgi:glycosyltransferase involved in cell wall biosynthesis
MKILFDHPLPFALAHGGAQIQIEQTKTALEKNGVEVEFLRWWDSRQKGDLIHYFGVPPAVNLEKARAKKIPVVITQLFSETCNRSDAQLRAQGWLVQTALRLPFGEGIKQQLAWRAFRACSHLVVGLEAERRVLELVHRVPQNRVSIVPLGLPEIFLNAAPASRSENFLIYAGAITAQKNCIPLARLAQKAGVPLLFVGKPFAENDPYWLEFRAMIDGRCVLHQPHIDDPAAMLALLQLARGAVLMSRFENWSFTIHEAAACGLPVLLPPLKWARECFGAQAHYFTGDETRDAAILRQFWESAPTLPAPTIKLHSWDEVARQLHAVYARVLDVSR